MKRLFVYILFSIGTLPYSFHSLNAQCTAPAPVPNNACYQQVVLNDSWCCFNTWDFICQGAYDDCMALGGGGCPVVAPVPNDACYQQVILGDPWCCNNAWDALCQSAYDACNPGGGPAVAGDCPDAIPICTINNFSIDPNGFGSTNELCTGCTSNPSTNPASANSGCLLSGELNSTWFSITVVASGTMEFAFGAPGGGNCYDWAMWDYNATACTNIANNTLAPTRCNWNGTCDSYTGLGPVPPGGYANNFEPVLNVVAGEQFILCFSNYSSAITNVPIAFSGSANIDCIPLSVELNALTATDHSGYNELNWSTLAEINCTHYEIERSTDGLQFDQIGSVEATGTANEAAQYRFEDYTPAMGLNYYRVRQVRTDGSAVLSSIVMAEQQERLGFHMIRSYPNPTEGDIHVQFMQSDASPVSVRVLSLSGEQYYSTTSSFPTGIHELTVPLSGLSQGMYLLEIRQHTSQHAESMKVSIR